MKDKNEDFYEFEYFAHQSIDGECIFTLKQAELQNSDYDKEQIDNSIRNKEAYCNYFWKRKRFNKELNLPVGSSLVDKHSSNYKEHIINLPNSSKIASPDKREKEFKNYLLDTLCEYFNNHTKIKALKSQKGNLCLYDPAGKYIGAFYIPESFFKLNLNTEEHEIKFYCVNEKSYSDGDIETSFYNCLENEKKMDNYCGQPITLMPVLKNKKQSIKKPKKINKNTIVRKIAS